MPNTQNHVVMPYVQRRPNGYFYRQRTPKLIRQAIGKTEWLYSLSTDCPKLAARRAAELYVAIHPPENNLIGDDLDHYELTHERASKIADRWKRLKLNEDFDLRLSARPPTDSPQALANKHRNAVEDLRRINLAPHVAMIDAVVSERHLDMPQESDDWRRLGYYLLKANTELLQELEKRSDLSQHHPMAYIPPEESEEDIDVQYLRISEALEGWSSDLERRPHTLSEWRTNVRRFIEIKGDLYVHDISVADIREFKTACLQIPRNLRGEDRKRKLPDILERHRNLDVQRLSADSVNKILASISSVLGWCVDNGYVTANVARGVRVPKPKITNKRRLPFSADDLKAIFEESPVFKDGKRPRGGAGHAAYWLPVLALYTGARLEEIGQLTIDDVRCEGDIDYLDINADGEGKSVKTQSSIRRVPLHPRLVELGFLDYLDKTRRHGHTDVFPYVRSKVAKRTASFSKWVNRYFRNTCGITDERKVFHSFRHTFKDTCRNSGIPRDIHDAITGHSDSSVGGRYGQGHSLVTLNDAIQNVSYGNLQIPPWQAVNR